jgi:hypothetical protein
LQGFIHAAKEQAMQVASFRQQLTVKDVPILSQKRLMFDSAQEN